MVNFNKLFASSNPHFPLLTLEVVILVGMRVLSLALVQDTARIVGHVVNLFLFHCILPFSDLSVKLLELRVTRLVGFGLLVKQAR